MYANPHHCFGWLAAFILLSAAGAVPQAVSAAVQEPAASELEREQALINTLSGATLSGSFTVTRTAAGPVPADAQQTLRPERYVIHKVEKFQHQLFTFHVLIQYGDREATTVAIPFPVVWAGDTPVITLTDTAVGPLGRFTARVLIYDDHYAGYWAGGDHAGTLFGTIIRNAED